MESAYASKNVEVIKMLAAEGLDKLTMCQSAFEVGHVDVLEDLVTRYPYFHEQIFSMAFV